MAKCPWCANPAAEDVEDVAQLCRWHLAEWEGLTPDELDRMEAEQLYDEL
jgi:broad specificity phosphatase PhoE